MKSIFRVYTLVCIVIAVISAAFVVIGVCRLVENDGTASSPVEREVVVERGEFRESIDGDFNGDGKVEVADLYCVSHDEEYEYNIYFNDNSIKVLDAETMVYSVREMTNEGDLNGDGADELGVFLHCGYSYWGTYTVYTYSKGEWSELVSVGRNPGWVECDMQELVRRNPIHSHCVIVKEINLDFPDMQERVVDLRRHK